MQKVVNVLALASAAVSLAVGGTAGYVFINKDAIIQGVTDKAMESVLGGGLGGAGGGFDVPSLGGDTLPTGANDLAPTNPQASKGAPTTGLGTPTF